MQGPLSPDGLYRWDGTRWVPTGAWAAPARAPMVPRPVTVRPPGFWAETGGAITAIVGAVVILLACLLPYAHYFDSTGGPSSPSLFNSGYPGGPWFAAEPVVVILVVIAAGVLLLAMRNRTGRTLAAGALLALGLQTFFLFTGYVGADASGLSTEIGAGAAIGVLGGIVVMVAGAVAAAGLFARGPSAPG